MKSPKRKYEPQSISKVLDEILESKSLRTGIIHVRINELWHEIMGANITHYTEKIILKGNTLFVSLNSSALRVELSYGKEKIIKMMNKQLGSEKIKKIVLR
ncbi:MAG: DUF721 domain-containing protein [Bacteroidota bacterium]|nr:DUF721 domain-containing protein [Bacteroidota bacterium]MEC9135619.1 DUF721 domain-containing protein [Bacteroidota bacterium]